MSDKMTTMVLKVDLHCSSCSKKIKKVLCKFRQIRNQVYDEKANTVTITVVCCNPEKMRDKLCCKGGKTIKSIQIIEKTKETEKIKVVEKIKEKEKQKVEEKTEESGKKPRSRGTAKKRKRPRWLKKSRRKRSRRWRKKPRSRGRANKFLRIGYVVGNVLKDITGGHVIRGMEGFGYAVGNVLKDITGGHVIRGMEGPFHAMMGTDMGTDIIKKRFVM